MALICRIRFPEPAGDPKEWSRILNGIRHSMPEVAASMMMSVTDKRAALRDHGFVLPKGTTSKEFPLVSIAHPRFKEAADRFAIKLFCSLYYKHTGRILPSDGRIFFVWRTNTDSFAEFFEGPGVSQLLAKFPKLTRQNRILDDQFSYRFNVAETNPPSAVFGCVFNHAAAMLGIVMGNTGNFSLPMPDDVLLRPFNYPETSKI